MSSPARHSQLHQLLKKRVPSTPAPTEPVANRSASVMPAISGDGTLISDQPHLVLTEAAYHASLSCDFSSEYDAFYRWLERRARDNAGLEVCTVFIFF